jgi:2-C-methyl-D-erythritol 4-phosphate cytidylyltransferase
MGAPHNKVFLALGGKPILVRTIEAFLRTHAVDELVLVAHPAEVAYCHAEIVQRYSLDRISAVIPGGGSRHDSEDCALAHLRSRIESGEVEIVLIHDGARPFVPPKEIDKLVQAARANGGAILAAPLADDEVILLTAKDGSILTAYAPAELARAHTPQAFAARTLLTAYDQARADGFNGTDTASSVERAGGKVFIVWSTAPNIKVTTPDDLLRAEALLASSHQHREGEEV